MSNIKFACPCGSVTAVSKADPVLMAYCHCDSCSRNYCSYIAPIGLWKVTDVEITGELETKTLTSGPNATLRKSCPKCHSRFTTDPGGKGHIAVLYPVLSEDMGKSWFKPAMHIYCQDAEGRNLRPSTIKDGLPKFYDLPPALGGTGKLLEENHPTL
ncbi:hypothetical protein M427DRAFT_58951 [Gonapodya prolifera JEL478]|uniref:CENP-V/GFA domain-containing protein n=1 Tax=Gonapodya prolifera (strain JEL478) TaxID=1344416 RepID=A0A139A8A8_GONPJ|nr:hypothetical protein M427DRAFT_58951 [Gonapodya prolifera JEL478]|eukprot:KXS13032.1 hypothetical protein M427DRAFT_58951 [Gonapodya prolifera JEL478]